MEQQENISEDVCWVQPADSLAFSVSPAGPSTSNNTRGDDGDDDHFFNGRDEEGDDEHPLVGEYIWDGDSGGGGLGNERRSLAAPSGELHRRLVDNEGLSPGPGSPPPVEAYDEGSLESKRSPDGRERCGELRGGEIEAEKLQESPRDIDERTNDSDRGSMDVENEEAQRRRNLQGPAGFPEHGWDSRDDIGGWVENDVEGFVEWNDGRPAESRGVDGDDEQNSRRESSSEGDLTHRQDQDIEGMPVFNNGRDADDHSSSSEEPQGGHEELESPVVRRRTRLSLDRERRRLDRVPRSQRLSQVKGHPLGGMTLLELEERHLLDVGIGQMARQLAKRGTDGVREANADLLRRSARLLRRAQEERDIRSYFEDERQYHREGFPSRPRDNTSGMVFRAEHLRRRGRRPVSGRRPASASRERHRMRSGSLSLESEGNGGSDRVSEQRSIRADARGYTAEGAPLVGLYSGGGTKCSLKQRRPMSAKPALTCGSGWEPGKARTRQQGSGRWDSEDTREAQFQRAARAAARALEDGGDGSDMSDLSPHGIVEYTDEAEGPFNVDELERVAASYLLRPRGCVQHFSAAVDDDRFADDGSVYIYREGNGSPTEHERGDEQHKNDVEAGRPNCNRSLFDRDYGRDQESRWQEERTEAPTHARGESVRNRETRGRGSGGDRPGASSQRDIHGPDSAERGQIAGGDLGGDVAAGMHNDDNAERGKTRQQQRSRSSDVGRTWNQVMGVGGKRAREVSARPDTHEEGRESGSGYVTLDGCASRPDHSEREDAPLGTFVPAAVASKPTDAEVRRPQVRGRNQESTGKAEGDAATEDGARVRHVASRLRDMILDRQASAGRSLRQIFGHFDRRRCGYVNVSEMRDALADLRLAVSADEARELHSLVTLDGGDRLSYAEFVVFISDPRHSELQDRLCRRAAQQLESLGRRSFHLDAVFDPAPVATFVPNVGAGPGTRAAQYASKDRRTARDANVRQLVGAGGAQAAEQRDIGGEQLIVSAAEFAAGLEALGLGLSASDIQRLVVRFDVHGDGYLSAGRFVSMVETSRHWTRALVRLAHQEEADEEAAACLRAYRMYGRWPAGQALSTETVEMARYIGIRVSSDSSLLWIANDALAAPLPEGWAMCKGHEGRWFYYNELTGQSRWEHPLDPYFRRVYLRERFGKVHADEEGGGEPIETPHSAAGRSRGASGVVVRGKPNRVRVANRSPAMLPPRRTRPTALDFSSDKALDNLRAHKLSGSASGRSAAATVAAEAMEPAYGRAHTNSDRATGEIWTNRGAGPRSPAEPRRRRPASASALREGLGGRNLGVKANLDNARPSNGDYSERFGSAAMAEALYSRPRSCTHGAGCGPVARLRRPRSAKAALQRAPADQQPHDGRRGERYDDRCHPGRTTNRDVHRSLQQPTSPTLGDERWIVQGANNEARARTDGSQCDRDVGQRYGGGRGPFRVGDDTRVREIEEREVAMNRERPWSHEEAAGASTDDEVERAWLRDRLADLCSKLDEADEIPRGGGHDPPRSSTHGRRRHPDRSRSNASEEGNISSETVDSEKYSMHKRGGISIREHSNLSPGSRGLLRDQVIELGNRMRDLETRLHGPSRPRSHGLSYEAGTAVAAAPPQPQPRHHDGSGSGGDGTGRRGSQDDLAYISMEGKTDELSKRSWPPLSGTARGRGVAARIGGSNSSSESLAFATGDEATTATAATRRFPRSEGVNSRATSGRNSGNGSSGGVGKDRRGSRGRRSCGIVLI